MDELEQNLIRLIAQKMSLAKKKVKNTLELLDAENTVPFITRYRQEQTGGLDEEQIRAIQSLAAEIRALADRREKLLAALVEQGKLTDELKQQIEQADSLKRLEELYAPFKSKRKTRADDAREMGLTPLANAIWDGKLPASALPAVAQNCVGKHPLLTSVEVVLTGTQDIIVERIAERADLRDVVRNTAWKTGAIESKLVPKSKDAETFKDYAKFSEVLIKAPPHRILALDRGEHKKALRVSTKWDQELAHIRVGGLLALNNHPARDFMVQCVDDALKRMINPSIEREIRRDLSDKAQEHAIEVFCKNLRNLLLQPPLRMKRVLAIDPAYRTGCKIVALDEDGNVLASDLISVVKPAEKEAMQEKLAELVKTHRCDVIAIGNGTASRETEALVAETISSRELGIKYIIVNEAGASVYSASEAGREEFPELDATVRGTISIGRRLQDPLSELVKIDPQHIGVGMYQHDVSEKQLQTSLAAVVESSVNHVGVDLNHASVELLKHVSGLSRSIAKKIVAYRNEHGPFSKRADLLQVSGIGEATYTQAAGFLKLPEGPEPLDSTWIHPESYPIARKLLSRFELQEDHLRSGKLPAEVQEKMVSVKADELANELETDVYTAQQLLQSLLKPGRDPREDLPGPVFRSEVLSFEDLAPGMELTGSVTNVVDFGAFVDVGIKGDGLVHVSKMSKTYVASPYEIVGVGDIVTVWIDSLDADRKRIGLTMLKPPLG